MELEKLIGNEHIKAQIKIAIGAARLHNRPLPHTLLAGVAGCGKSSTAKAIAADSGGLFLRVDPEALKTAEDIQKVFEKLSDNGYDNNGNIVGTISPAIIFIDEVHRLPLKAEEMLGIAMEERLHSFTSGIGRRKEKLTTWVPHFTLVAATTKEGDLSRPFRERFKLTFIFSHYSLAESIRIVKLHAEKMGISIEENAVVRIAQRGRGTPRLLVGYLERVRDGAAVLRRETVTIDVVEATFQMMGIDPEGLTKSDIIILKKLYETNAPVGLEPLALLTNQDQRTVSEVNEPYLLRLGFIERSKQGRTITAPGENYLAKNGHIKKEEKAVGRIVQRGR